jgi:ribonuclease HI
MSKWIAGWKKKGWPSKIKNQDLWKRLDAAASQHTIEWIWGKGHAGDRMNERADALADQAARQYV